MSLLIDAIYGNCPVQGEGSVAGKPFYFRARWEHWSMGIGGDPVVEPEWYREQKWGDGPYAAGWMEEEEAKRIIELCAADYLAGRAGNT